MLPTGWHSRLQAALGSSLPPGPLPQDITHIIKPLAGTYMRALAYKAPSILLLSSLHAAIRNSNTFAAQALLSAPDSLAATPLSQYPEYDDSETIVNQTLESCPPMDCRNMLKIITQAFTDQNRPDLLAYAAAGALSGDDAALFTWQLELMSRVCSRDELAITFASIVQFNRLQQLQQMLALPGGHWLEHQLEPALAAAAEFGRVEAGRLLLDAIPHWSNTTLAAALGEATTLEVAELLLHAAVAPWSPVDLIDPLCSLVAATETPEIVQIVRAVIAAAAVPWTMAHFTLAINEAARFGVPDVVSLLLALCPLRPSFDSLQAAMVEAVHGLNHSTLAVLLTKVRWSACQLSMLSRVVVEAVKSGRMDLLQLLLQAPPQGRSSGCSRKSLWQAQDLMQAAEEALRMRNPSALQAVLKAAGNGWVKGQILALAGTAVQLRESDLLQGLLAPGTGQWTAEDLKGLLCMVAREWCVGLEVVLKQLRTATGEVGSHMPTLKAGLMEAVSVSCSGCLKALIAAAPKAWQASDLVDAAVVAVQLGHKEALKFVLGGYSKAWKPALLLPAVSAAAKGRDLSLATEVLSAAPARGWQGWMVEEVLCVAVKGKAADVVDAVLQAVDGWQPAELANSLGEAAAQGDAVLVGTLLTAAAFPWQPLHLAPAVFMTVKCKAGLNMLRALLTAAAVGWRVGNLREAVAEAARGHDALNYVGELLKATEQEEWQPGDLADAAEEAVRHQRGVLRVLLEAPKEGCKAWQDTQLLGRLFTAAAIT